MEIAGLPVRQRLQGAGGPDRHPGPDGRVQPVPLALDVGDAVFHRTEGVPDPLAGNAELLVYLLVWLVLTLIWLFSDEVGAGTFATLTVALTFGYLISRGIAKASRVLEQ